MKDQNTCQVFNCENLVQTMSQVDFHKSRETAVCSECLMSENEAIRKEAEKLNRGFSEEELPF